MFNYRHPSSMTHWTYSSERKGFIVETSENIKKGEEVIYTILVTIDFRIIWEQTKFKLFPFLWICNSQ